jgi:hypothetical protein
LNNKTTPTLTDTKSGNRAKSRKNPVINQSAKNITLLKLMFMPWPKGDYPPSYKNQPKKIREKAVEIANVVLDETGDEGIAIATGLKKAREFFEDEKAKTATSKKKHDNTK